MKRFKQLITNQKFLFWFLTVGLIVTNVMMFFTESTSLMTRLVQIVLPFAFYWLMMTLTKKPGKMFWVLFIFAFYDAFQIVLLQLYGETPLAVDMLLNVTTTNVTEASELLANILPSVVFAVTLYTTCIVLSIVSIRSHNVLEADYRRRQRRYAAITLALGVAMLIGNYFITPNFKVQDDVFPVNAGYNTYLAVDRFHRTSQYHETSKGFTYQAHCELADTASMITVVVVGETARADNFGIYGYNRDTTPRLKAMGDDLAVCRDVITMSNTTHKSVPLLMTDIACQRWDSIYHRKGMISAFVEAGYKTAYYSNQRRNHAFIDFFGEEADEVVFTKDSVSMVTNVSDDALKALVSKRLENYDGGKLLIVLHCYGSHFNYRDRYPKEGAFFNPDNVIAASPGQRKILVNAYDNTIRFDDNLLGDIIDMLKSKEVPSLMVFTSDHGEDIYDDSRNRFLHASPLPTYYQLRVPLLFWASDEYKSEQPERWRQLLAHRDIPMNSNMVFFHTILDLNAISSPYLRPSLALDNKAFRKSHRMFVNDHNEYIPIERSGLKQLDIEQFKAHGLAYP